MKIILPILSFLFMGFIVMEESNLNSDPVVSVAETESVDRNKSMIDEMFKEDTFCWRETYGRGVGAIPVICPDGMENQAGLCYTLCKPGYHGVGPVCWANCPEGYRDDGAFCYKPEASGRAGYPWMVGDPLNDVNMFKRCEADNGKGNCVKEGLIVYAKCKEGYKAAGCCICSPICPDGWADFGVSCAKPSYGRGVGVVPTICEDGTENNAGLCYKMCKDNYLGVGPVCWEVTCPLVNGKQWTDCGAGCAESTATCVTAVIDMATSPLVAVLSIAGMVVTGGGSSAITATAATGKVLRYTAKAVKGVSKITQAAIKADLIAKAKEQLKGKPMSASQKKGLEEYAAMAYDAARAYNFDWRDFAGFDPTGLGGVAAAYANPLCKNVKGSTMGVPPVVSPPAASMAPLNNGFVRIQNSLKPANYIHNQNGGKLEHGAIQPNWWSSQWKLVPVGGGFVRIQNRWKPTQYLHNQNGPLELGTMQPNWWSAQWKVVPASNGWSRIQNRWKSTHYLHIQNGKLDSSPINNNWASALWKLQ